MSVWLGRVIIGQKIPPNLLQRFTSLHYSTSFITDKYNNYNVNNITVTHCLIRCGRTIIVSNCLQYSRSNFKVNRRTSAKIFNFDRSWMVGNGSGLVNYPVCFELPLHLSVCKISSGRHRTCCQPRPPRYREFLKPFQASPDGHRHLSTERHRSEELRRKIAEDNKRMREQFEAREREWEARVDRYLLCPEDVEIYEAHKAAVARGHFTYDDPSTGYRVMTRLRHFWRGSCCGNACRHVRWSLW